ncbi:MAG: type II toxin-antitoxin system antitoxin SocA domain-containing protein [Sphaerochaeta sp.]
MSKPPASRVALYIVGLKRVNPLKLQYLTYYCQAVHLARVGKPLFDDIIEAGIYGPFISGMYQEYKKFGFEPITPPLDAHTRVLHLSLEEMKTIDMVLAYYGDMSAIQLMNEAHHDGPWKEHYVAKKNIPIPIDTIRTFYTNVLTFT